MTKTERLRAALISRGFQPTETKAHIECLQGSTRDGRKIWVWPNKTGAAWWSMRPEKGTALAMSTSTADKIISGQSMAVVADVVAK